MFEILNQVPEDDAVEAVYEATLQLYQHDRLGTLRDGGFPLSENKLAVQLLDEISEAEEKHVADLPKETTKRYIVEVSEVLHRRIREGLSEADEAQGEAILAEMRVQYAWPHYGRPERGAPVQPERRAVG
jgi:DNA-binding transcriptional MerR regulator